MNRFFMLREAIASVSLSHRHPEDEPCDICAATKGDEDALARVIIKLEEYERRP